MGAAPLTLVGRDDEIELLRRALEDAAAGQGRLLLASGEPGIGKTRLLEEAGREASRRGFAVAWGRAWEAGGAPEYWPWIQVLRSLQRAVGGELAGLGAELGGGGGSETDRFALFDRVVGALGGAAAAKPLLLLLDDLHAADPSSLRLLELLVLQLADLPILVVASYRDVEARLAPEIGDLVARIGRGGLLVPLGRLGPEGVAALVREAGTLPDDPGVARMVHAATEGNPLFVGELVRLIAARSELPPGGRLPVPDGVRAVMRERLRLLGPDCLPVLEIAAVLGREFNAPLLAEVAGVDVEAVPSRLARALASALVEERGPGHYLFSHALVAETLVSDLDPGRRADLHRAVAEALERRHAGDPDGALVEIAHHYLEAGAPAALAAARAALRAAEHAMRGLAFEDAAALLERALVAETLVTPPDGPRRAELLLALGEACLRAGSSERGKEACREAGALGRAHGSASLVARAALTYGIEFSFAVVDPALVRLLEEARDVLPADDSPLRGRVLARLAGALQPALDPGPPMAIARDAIAMARRLGDAHADARLEILHTAGAALVDYAPPAERIALSREVIALARQPRDRLRGLRARLRLVFDHLELADLAGFGDAVGAYAAAVEEFPQARVRWPLLLVQAMRALLEGRFADDARYADDAEALSARARDPNLTRALAVHRLIAARVACRRDEVRAAAQAHHATMAAAMATVAPRVQQLWIVLFDLPPPDQVAPALAAFSHAELVTMCQDFNLACLLTEVVAERRDAPLAEKLYEALAPRAGSLCIATMMGFAVQDLGDRALLLLCTARRAWADVDRHARAALALAERLGSRPFAARVRHDWARALVEEGSGDGAARAGALFEEALEIAQRIDMPGLAEDCRKALASGTDGRPAGRPASVARPGRVEARREGDTWTVSWGGAPCRVRDSRGMQMLARLLEQPRVELHVLDLAGADRGAVDGGDAGETLDAAARAAYRARLADLGEELEEAESWNDPGRAEKARDERQALEAELARAVGLGGRERRQGRAAERARVNVQRRITDAIRRIQEQSPELGRYLSVTVRTGTTCVYEPFD
jgi:hypothetical protein